tara:strand:- start:119 stop:295 length:177 start_codon:yes stop_codon:yes gene_type:complete
MYRPHRAWRVAYSKKFNLSRRKIMIEELLDKYHVDDFDDLLIEIIKRMKERKEEEDEE